MREASRGASTRTRSCEHHEASALKSILEACVGRVENRLVGPRLSRHVVGLRERHHIARRRIDHVEPSLVNPTRGTGLDVDRDHDPAASGRPMSDYLHDGFRIAVKRKVIRDACPRGVDVGAHDVASFRQVRDPEEFAAVDSGAMGIGIQACDEPAGCDPDDDSNSVGLRLHRHRASRQRARCKDLLEGPSRPCRREGVAWLNRPNALRCVVVPNVAVENDRDAGDASSDKCRQVRRSGERWLLSGRRGGVGLGERRCRLGKRRTIPTEPDRQEHERPNAAMRCYDCYSISSRQRRSAPRLPSADDETSLMLSYVPCKLRPFPNRHSMLERSSWSPERSVVMLARTSFVRRLPIVSWGSVLPVVVEYALPEAENHR